MFRGRDANASYSKFIDSFHFHMIKYFQLLPKELKFATNLGLHLNCHNKVITKEKRTVQKVIKAKVDCYDQVQEL